MSEDLATLRAYSCLEERSSQPAVPKKEDTYLDDGTNTVSGEPGLRYFTGTVWQDISGAIR